MRGSNPTERRAQLQWRHGLAPEALPTYVDFDIGYKCTLTLPSDCHGASDRRRSCMYYIPATTPTDAYLSSTVQGLAVHARTAQPVHGPLRARARDHGGAPCDAPRRSHDEARSRDMFARNGARLAFGLGPLSPC